jgi:hypothetical protein
MEIAEPEAAADPMQRVARERAANRDEVLSKASSSGIIGSLDGNQIGDNFGVGGLGLRGSGRGGGGTGEGTIGLGNLGVIGPGGGGGSGSGFGRGDGDDQRGAFWQQNAAELDLQLATIPSVPDTGAHAARRCSASSRQRLTDRVALWRERLQNRNGIDGAMGVYRQARALCELPGFRDRRALLGLLLDTVAAQEGPQAWSALPASSAAAGASRPSFGARSSPASARPPTYGSSTRASASAAVSTGRPSSRCSSAPRPRP